MPAVQMQPVAVPSLDKVKMDDRKRSLVPDTDDLAPSRKRLLKDESGQAMRMDAEKEKDVEVRTLFASSHCCTILTARRTTKRTPSCDR